LHSGTIYNPKQNCWNTKKFKIFTSGERRNQAAIVVTNTQVDAILMKQLSDADTVVLEIIIDTLKIILVIMYFDIV